MREKNDDDEMQGRENLLGGKIREVINLGGGSRTLHVQLQTTLVSQRYQLSRLLRGAQTDRCRRDEK